jgi:aspartate/glutamate racemase
MEMDKREGPLRQALLDAADELCNDGAKILAHPANTTHHFANDIASRAKERGARFLSMAESTAKSLRSRGIEEIALLGTRYVTDFTQRWSAYKDVLKEFKVHTPSPEGWKKIHDLAYEVQQKGATSLAINWMRDLLRDEVPISCENVVLAMTEFTPIVRRLKTRGLQGKKLIDPMDIYAETIAYEFLGLEEK